ncbi:MAG: diaminopimelate decarboxylase [Saprospirales bacterium]|nr:MAG: diaminopimelate decarboxylase [Saprospirales bacterium]
MTESEIKEKQLGKALLKLTQKYGSPLYAYFTEDIEKNYRKLRSAFGDEGVHIMYACKALTNLVVLKFLKKLGCGLDAVSLEEAKLGLLAGFKGREIVFTPSMVGGADYDKAVEYGLRINVGDLQALEYMGKNHPNYPVCIRLNPHVYAGGHEKISVGHVQSKFGISIFQMDEVLDLVKKYSIRVDGVHMHAGSDIQKDEQYMEAIGVIFGKAEFFPDLEYVDIGSGFKIPYRSSDTSSNLEKIASFVKEKLNTLSVKLNKRVELLMEPGKFLVSNAGYFIVEATVVKKAPGKTFVGVDSGFNHLMRPMLYDAWHDVINLSNPNGKSQKYDLVGYICETDTFATDREVAEIRVGDFLTFKNTGAYGFNMASNYNSKLRPAEVLVHEGKDYLIRRRETFEDLISTQVLPDLFY